MFSVVVSVNAIRCHAHEMKQNEVRIKLLKIEIASQKIISR